MKTGARTGGDKDSGRTCPYCRFTLKADVLVVDCGVCGAPHHAECWADNGGCAVFGCAGAPSTVMGEVPPRAAPPVAPAPPAVAPAPAPAARDSRSPTMLVAAILFLALALAGGAAAVVLTDRASAPTARPTVVTVTPTVTVPGPAPAPPSQTPRERRVAAIEPLVRSYFDAIRNGDYDAAWEMLSVKYRTWKTSLVDGRAKWQRSEANVRAHVTGTATVRETEYDRASGVSTIFVSGLSYMQPDGTPCAYEGYTWARRSETGWAYDQGYLHVAARRARWRPVREQTLGVLCDRSSY